MPKQCTVIAIVGIMLCCGCHQYGYYPKRQSELNCPTDIRQTVPWCAGEDAVFRCPCGPSSHFHGHKPTCWGNWPSSGSEWRDSYCGCPVVYATEGESIPTPAAETLPEVFQPPSGEGAQRLKSLPTFESEPQPLFVAPPKAVSVQEPARKADTPANHAFANKIRAKEAKNHSPTENSDRARGEIKQVSYIEEQSLEAHSWTGPQFIR